MSTLTHDGPATLAELDTIEALLDAAPAGWSDRRAAAWAALREAGMPTRRDEAWRFTDLKSLYGLELTRPEVDTSIAGEAAAHAVPGLGAPHVVLVNGRITDAGRPGPVADFLSVAGPQRGDARLGRLTEGDRWPMVVLNDACLEEALVISVPPGVAIETPVYILNLVATDTPAAMHPRLVIDVGEGASITVVEDHVGVRPGPSFTNSLTEFSVAANARVEHYLLERENDASFHVSSMRSLQQRDSHFASHQVLLGGRIVRNQVHPVLDGPGGFSLLNGLYVGQGQQHFDNQMLVEHAKPHCDSRQHYHGILTDRSRGVFTGRILVAEDAQKTDAVQHNANLLLSPDATANTQPQLEIYADDVKCTHGATIGELDEEALFYLRARGLGEAAARSLLVFAFAREALDRMELEPVRREVERQLLTRLPNPGALAGALD